MNDIEIYNLAGWLGDVKTLFNLLEKDLTPELDHYLFLEDLSWHYAGDNFVDYYDIGFHVEEILGTEVSFFLEEF